MNLWKVVLATLAIFGAGVLTGGLLVGYSDRAWHFSARKPPEAKPPPVEPVETTPGYARLNRVPPPMPVPLRREFLERLDRELKLTATQREHIEAIISEGQDQTRKVWQQVEPQMRVELGKTRDRIRAELTPEQQTQFEELLRQRPRDQRGRPMPPGERPALSKPRP